MKFASTLLLSIALFPATTLLSGCGPAIEDATVLPAPELTQEELEELAAIEAAPVPPTVD